LRPDSGLAFQCQVRQMHRMHGTKGIIFADVSCRGARPTRWVAGGVRPTRLVVEGVLRTPKNKHLDLEVVREKVKGWSTPAGCGKILDGIERYRVKRSVSGGVWDGAGIGRGPQDGIRRSTVS